MKLRKLNFSKCEVISFIEDKLLHNECSYEEELFYTNYVWNNRLNKYTYEQIKRDMKLQYN